MISVIVVLWAPIPGIDASVTAKDLLDYRQSILIAIITAFSAWVGAGAAYFFGRENLREATQKMLEMREQPPIERLRQTSISEIPLRQIDWAVKIDDKLKIAYDKLREEPELWFIPIVKEDGTLHTVLEDEAIFLYVIDKKETVGTLEDVLDGTMDDVLKYLKEQKKLQKHTEDIYVEVKLGNKAGYAHDLMRVKGVKLSIVTNQKGEPTHFLTTDDLRRLLMKESA